MKSFGIKLRKETEEEQESRVPIFWPHLKVSQQRYFCAITIIIVIILIAIIIIFLVMIIIVIIMIIILIIILVMIIIVNGEISASRQSQGALITGQSLVWAVAAYHLLGRSSTLFVNRLKI